MPSKSKTSLKVLQSRLRGLQTSFDNMCKFMDDYTEDTKLTEVKVRLEKLDILWDRINQSTEEIEAHEDSTAEEESQLEGEALAVIDSLPLTRANYNVAWDLICTRYSNSKILRKRQVQALFELPVVKKESATELHTLLESYEKIVKSLDQATPQATEFKDLLLLHLLSSRLDGATRRSWEEHSSTKDVDTVRDLTNFLQRRIQILEALPTRPVEQRIEAGSSKFPRKPNVVKVCNTTLQPSAPLKCVACSDSHLLYQCSQFLKLPVSERDGLLRSHSLCRNCFRRGHQARDCHSKFTCRQCKGKHHTLVCFKGKVEERRSNHTGESGPTTTAAQPTEEVTNTKVVNVATTNVVSCNSASGSSTGVLLLTAMVLLEDDRGQTVRARALLDSAAECNLITKRMRKQLVVKEDSSMVEVVGIHGTSNKVHGKVTVTVRSCISNFAQGMEFYVLPKLSAQPGIASVDPKNWNLPAGIELADPHFLKSEPIDLVIGAEFFFDVFVTGRRISLGEHLPLLVDSVFGWIATGRYPIDGPITSVLCDVATSSRLEKMIEKFWEYEEVGLGNNMSPDEAKCEEYFQRTTQRQASGRYMVSLPGNEEMMRNLGDSKATAERRFLQIERRLNREPSLREQYVSFMEEYETLGHMSRVTHDEEGVNRCYLPHHPVVKEGSTTTRLATDEAERFPLASVAVKNDFYMDDAITGANDPATAKELRIQLVEMLDSGGFKLRKFASNCATVLEGIPSEDLSIQAADGIYLDPDPMVKTLGLIWIPPTDVFRFNFKAPPLSDTPLTKQKIFSIIATLFDPLGFVGPVITQAKIIMQLSWQLLDDKGQRLAWDSPLPQRVEQEFRKFYEHIPLLNDLRIERLVIIPLAVRTQLHIFSDASEKALGACVYVRTEDSSGRIKVALLLSKSRIAPLKTQTIPRLELRAATLAAEMFSQVTEAIDTAFDVFFWTDSEIVLRWCAATPSTWTTFVANRVAKIQRLTENCCWSHVPGEKNPADLISRGIPPEEILDNRLWWDVEWLHTTMEHWPKQKEFSATGLAEERRQVVLSSTSSNPSFIEEHIARFSTYTTMIRQTAWCRRYLRNLREEAGKRKVGPLTIEELLQAESKIIQRVQEEVFGRELKAISKGESVPRQSPLRWYCPFVAPDGLLRVGGRLGKSGECEDAKHPIVLPARHSLTKLIIRHYHLKLLHAGPQLILSTVRLRFWPLGGRNVARQVCHECMRCYRTKPATIRQFMAELPTPRVVPAKPFSTTGVDYFGPIYVRPGYRRAAVKAYVAVFVCFSTKAVHLELATDLSTPCFIQALRRFISRRGKCAQLFSDNGTNFVGARNAMEKLLQNLRSKEHNETVAKWCTDEGMQWSFIPPGAPHFGGLWESAVRSTKVHLLKVLGDTAVSYEDMTTLLAQVECCLNSRPLTPLSDDPEDLEALTPGHFLVTTSLQALLEENLTNISPGRLQHRELIQQCLQFYWKRWRSEYLTQLQARTKWWQPPQEIKTGSLVVIRDDNQPPTRWRMARIHAVHPGDDNVVRVVTLKTADGFIKRPVTKICILPVANPAETEAADPKETTETPAVSGEGRMLETP
ncbi:uncharacterized protein LOC134286719 [Aedes albopictus]|uniref:Endonuclease n=1 Tax=Aedes albopictus TaxID=7160 RepID=A0ABM1YGG2_AEDAL